IHLGGPLRMAMDNMVKGVALQQTVGDLSQDLVAITSYLSVMVADILPRETFEWKLKILKSASGFANSRLHTVKAQTLLLSRSLLYSTIIHIFYVDFIYFLSNWQYSQKANHSAVREDAYRFSNAAYVCQEDGLDVETIIKGASFYRREKFHDYVKDFVPPTPSEFTKIYESNRLIVAAMSPIMLSTLEDGKIVKGLAGIPSDGPVLFIGYHMLLGLDLAPMVCQFMMERNILLRGMAHPLMFFRAKDGDLPESTFNTVRVMGAIPVTATNFYKLLSSKSHVLLYPGGMREAIHMKGEQYKLIWPEQSEFVRMAARFGAKIVPFAHVGEDDFGEVVFDLNEQMKIPYFKAKIEEYTDETVRLGTDVEGEVGNQKIHLPWILPKVPGQLYYYFGKPIETAGREKELMEKEKARELYLQIKSGVKNCIVYLKEKRENNPYRNILARVTYQATHGFTSDVPTFDL
ncbi:LOW QUALITY PROTEIN: DAGAT domain-containing protein, partial [Cephalotus follicularis]